MASLRNGLVDTSEAFGKRGMDFETTIKSIGWSETPFLSTIGTAAPADRSSNAALGHGWFYDILPDGDDDNAHFEGGAMAEVKKASGASLKNHYQIVKNAFGVTGSEEMSKNINGKASLSRELEQASIAHKKTIEKILLSETQATARVNSGSKVAGKCGGLKSFATAQNTIDAANKDLEWQHILNLLKVGYLNGGSYKIIMMSDIQKDKLDNLLFKKVQATMDINYLGTTVSAIKQTSYGGGIKILLNPLLAENEIIAYRPEDIFKVNWRPMKIVDRVSTDDDTKKEIISEFTLRVCTPFAFAWLKNLKV